MYDTCSGLVWIFVFPDANGRPAGFGKKPIDLAISLLVTSDLLSPVLRVGNRYGVMRGTAVPETPIDEYRDLCSGEHQVRRSAHTFEWPHRHSVAQPTGVHGPTYGKLRLRVARPVRLHALAVAFT
jgi:hypothetical protein